MRKPHYLKPTKGDKRPARIIFFDTETEATTLENGDIVHKLRLGHAIFCNTRRGKTLKIIERLDFTTEDEFWDFVEKHVASKQKLHLVAHNIQFDLAILHGYRQLGTRNFIRTKLYMSGLIAIVGWSRGDGKILGLDNSNFYEGKLSVWGDYLELPKLEVDFMGDDEQLRVYCQRDCDILHKLWLKWFEFLDENKIGNFKMTTASTAFEAFRRSFMSEKIYIHNNEAALKLERKAYRGGRTEVFFYGSVQNTNVNYLDVNSMYAEVMRKNEYPTQWYYNVTNPPIAGIELLLKSKCIIADVVVRTREALYPYKITKDDIPPTLGDRRLNNTDYNSLIGKTVYPVGEFRTTLTTPELLYGLNRGYIIHIHEAAIYRKGNIFKHYVKHFGALKEHYTEKGDVLFRQIVKMLLNSLYGKFGQTGFTEYDIGECDVDTVEIWDGVYGEDMMKHMLLFLGGRITERFFDKESYHSFPAIAAHVTAHARVLLWTYLLRAGLRHVYYCDTDGFWTNAQGTKNLKSEIDPVKIGKLKEEYSSKTLDIYGAKDYSFDQVIKLKGIKKNAIELTEAVYMQYMWPGLRGMIRKGDMEEYRVRLVVKRLSRAQTAGVVSSQGWVQPFRLPFLPSGLHRAKDLSTYLALFGRDAP